MNDDQLPQKMISAGSPIQAFDFDARVTLCPAERALVPYALITKNEAERLAWNEILLSKYKNSKKFLSHIDSMAAHLVHCNMWSMLAIPQIQRESKVARHARMWKESMKHSFTMNLQTRTPGVRRKVIMSTPTFYSILEFLIGSPSAWKHSNATHAPKKRKQPSCNDDITEDEAAAEMWQSAKVRRSVPTILMNTKFTCKALYALVDWRAIAFAFQRYVDPTFVIPRKENWNSIGYFRHYVLKQCAVPDYPFYNRGLARVSTLQYLLHRYANYCYQRIGVFMLYERTQSHVFRRVFAVKNARVNNAGTPIIPKKDAETNPWSSKTHIFGDLVERNGVIHDEAVSGLNPKFYARQSGWSALEQDVYLIVETPKVFCGTRQKLEIETILGESCVANALDNEEEEEGEEGVFEDHGGWLLNDENDEEEEGEYMAEDDEKIKPKRRLTRAVNIDWVREEQESDDYSSRTKKRRNAKSSGVFESQMNEIDRMDDEEEFQFKTKKRR
jgi:hypothetical protein